MKVGIVGTGAVGSACLLSVVVRGSASEVDLVNRHRKRAQGVVTDEGFCANCCRTRRSEHEQNPYATVRARFRTDSDTTFPRKTKPIWAVSPKKRWIQRSPRLRAERSRLSADKQHMRMPRAGLP